MGKSLLIVVGLAFGNACGQGLNSRSPNGAGQKPAFAGQTRVAEQKLGVAFEVVPITDALKQPWGIAFLPDGRMLVTEKQGRLRIVTQAGQISEPLTGLPQVDPRNQGGLLGVAVDPKFASNSLFYVSYSEPQADGFNNTAVAKGKLVLTGAPRVENAQVIFHQTPKLRSTLHFGSRLVFSPDGTLFVTMGDRSVTEGRMQAQRMDGLLGKVARINTDGGVPNDNPFVGKAGVKPEIWSLGHRNIQGAALHPKTGELWTIEHGTRGGDELNVAKKGKDYGWPTIAYGIEYGGGTITGGIQAKEGMEQPVYYWDPVIAPGGMTFYTSSMFPAWQNSVLIGGLGSTHLVRLTLDGEKVVGEERLLTDMGQRLRDVVQGPDGALYICTDGGRLFKLVAKK